MFAVFRIILDVIMLTVSLSRPAGKSLLVAEHILVRQQLLMMRRKRSRAPQLTLIDRLVFSVATLFFARHVSKNSLSLLLTRR